MTLAILLNFKMPSHFYRYQITYVYKDIVYIRICAVLAGYQKHVPSSVN